MREVIGLHLSIDSIDLKLRSMCTVALVVNKTSMSSAYFLARFKDKSSTLDKSGTIDVTFSKPVDLPATSRLPPMERDLSPGLPEVKSSQLLRLKSL